MTKEILTSVLLAALTGCATVGSGPDAKRDTGAYNTRFRTVVHVVDGIGRPVADAMVRAEVTMKHFSFTMFPEPSATHRTIEAKTGPDGKAVIAGKASSVYLYVRKAGFVEAKHILRLYAERAPTSLEVVLKTETTSNQASQDTSLRADHER